MRAVRKALLAWYDRHRRDLPWRRTCDPYAIWISEAMLQQTRVETVIPYYERFLARFPDATSLATADADDVMRHWAGLGYYGRARNLHAAAQAVVERHGGHLPDDPVALRALPGVGRYTAGAVASMAFDRPEPVVDGNVARVLARLLDLRDDVRGAATQRRLWQTAEALVAGPRPGALNQALMDFGATLCTPRAPRCGACPLARHCRGLAAGDPQRLPVKARRRPSPRVRAVCALVVRRGRALAVRRPPRGLLGGLWELPGGELTNGEAPAGGLARALREAVGLEVDAPTPLGSVEHVFSHRILDLEVFRAEAAPGRVRLAGFDAHRWLAPRRFGELPTSAVMRKALRLVEGA